MTRHLRRAAIVVLIRDEKAAAVLRRVVDEIWNGGNIDLADELFSSDYVNHGGLIPDLVKGPEGVKFSVALYRTAFPGLSVRVDSLSSSSGTVHMRWTARTRAADHALSGAMRSSVVAGQIVESWTSWDSTAVLLGMGTSVPGHEGTS